MTPQPITINATLVYEIPTKNHWINYFPGAVPKIPSVEKYLFVDKNGNTVAVGEDFMNAEKEATFPIKVYLLQRVSHLSNVEYFEKLKQLFN